MITTHETRDGRTVQIVTCDGEACPARAGALGPDAVRRAERILRPDGHGRHYCPACRVRLSGGIVQIPHPEHG